MSYKKKQGNRNTASSAQTVQQQVEQIDNEYLIIEKRGDIVNLKVRNDLDEDWKLTLNNFLEDNVHYDKKKNVYQVKHKDFVSFLGDITSLHTRYTSMKEKRKSKKTSSESKSRSASESESNSASESDSDSTDDELIQQTLTRKLKYESKQSVIPDEVVSDSEMEDVISLCRRMRHLYLEVKALKQRISQLETSGNVEKTV